MKELVSQRQKEIMEHAAATRKSIRDSEIAKLREEFGEEDANAMIAQMDAQKAGGRGKKRGNRRRVSTSAWETQTHLGRCSAPRWGP